MIAIDGSFGEGGGQILRSALALSMVTRQPFQIEKIRAGRKKPGLMRQHLTAVQAAAGVCSAKVSGDVISSTEITFEPGPTRGGDYLFSIGTAGSTTLVLQTVLLPLLLADKPSRLVLEGGTHNPFAPPFDFLVGAYLPLINLMGPRVSALLERPGFFPAGGGRMIVEIEPSAVLRGFELLERGTLLRRHAKVIHANIPSHVADRELKVVRRRLNWDDSNLSIEHVDGVAGPGNVLLITLEYENVTEVFTSFGQIGRSAEQVAAQAVEECRRYVSSTAPAAAYLTDQLMLPMAVAGNGAFRSTGLSLHAKTHSELIGKFLNVPIEPRGDANTGDVVLRFGSNLSDDAALT